MKNKIFFEIVTALLILSLFNGCAKKEDMEAVHIALSANTNILNTNAPVIRSYLSAKNEAKVLSNFIRSNFKFNRIVAFTINDDYGLSFVKEFEKYIDAEKFVNVNIEYGQQDFKNLIIKEKFIVDDIVLIIEHGTQVSYNLIKQLKTYHPEIQIFSNSSIASSSIVSNLNNTYIDGLICSTTPFDLGIYNAKAKKFINDYQNEYKSSNINLGQAFAYDAIINYFTVNNNFYKKSIIKIGAVFPLTGNYSWFGELNAKGIKLAVKNINTPDKHIDLFMLDNKSTIKDGINAAKKLLHQEKVDVIISTPSSLSLAINELLRSNHNGDKIKNMYADLFSNSSGVIGEFSYSNDGDIISNVLIGIFKNGELKPYE
jgi:ABC-type branched-subunit amino acid transport system substrate-binding protein